VSRRHAAPALRPEPVRPPALIIAGLMTLALAGCGSSRSSSASACRPQARAALVRALPRTRIAISEKSSIGSQGMPECHLVASTQARDQVKLTATIDTAPQAYTRLERAAVEAGQNLSLVGNSTAPQNISGLGLDADWFLDESKLMTSDGTRLITVAVSWDSASQKRKRELARVVAAAYLDPRKS
jgi:hypothetical protein